jgi:carboxypeptidase PM20D1
MAHQDVVPVTASTESDWRHGPFDGVIDEGAVWGRGSVDSKSPLIAPTMLRGSPKENVLPQDAAAWINHRIAPWQTYAEVLDRARAATAGLGVAVDWQRPPYEPSPVPSITSRSWQILSTVAAKGGEWPVAPGLVTAATDSRSLTAVATDIYRFQAVVASLREFEMIHDTNEHLTLDNLARMTNFYTRLISTAAR